LFHGFKAALAFYELLPAHIDGPIVVTEDNSSAPADEQDAYEEDEKEEEEGGEDDEEGQKDEEGIRLLARAVWGLKARRCSEDGGGRHGDLRVLVRRGTAMSNIT
jgi:hypothetical protein